MAEVSGVCKSLNFRTAGLFRGFSACSLTTVLAGDADLYGCFKLSGDFLSYAATGLTLPGLESDTKDMNINDSSDFAAFGLSLDNPLSIVP
jgi:hypothetical protein